MNLLNRIKERIHWAWRLFFPRRRKVVEGKVVAVCRVPRAARLSLCAPILCTPASD